MVIAIALGVGCGKEQSQTAAVDDAAAIRSDNNIVVLLDAGPGPDLIDAVAPLADAAIVDAAAPDAARRRPPPQPTVIRTAVPAYGLPPRHEDIPPM